MDGAGTQHRLLREQNTLCPKKEDQDQRLAIGVIKGACGSHELGALHVLVYGSPIAFLNC